jgi:hypothetical protein
VADEVNTVGIPSGDRPDGNGSVKTETRPDDAPWGYKPDGTPYRVDPQRYRTRAANEAKAKGGKAKGGKASPYRDNALGLIQMIGLPLAVAGSRDERFMADLVALNTTAPGIADAVDAIAQSNRRMAAALDKLAEVGPYGLLIGALTPLVLQVATNHGLLPAGMLGTVEPDVLLDSIEDMTGATAEAAGAAA